MLPGRLPNQRKGEKESESLSQVVDSAGSSLVGSPRNTEDPCYTFTLSPLVQDPPPLRKPLGKASERIRHRRGRRRGVWTVSLKEL